MKKIANINVTAFLKEVTEMDADCIGWYTKLILHEFDKGSLPNNTEKLAALCGVNYSNYPRFQRVYTRYIRDKFTTDKNQRLVHADMSKLIEVKDYYMNKRMIAGKKSYLIRFLKKEYNMEDNLICYIKDQIDFVEIDLRNKEELKILIDSILNNRSVVFLKKKDREKRVCREEKRIAKIQDLNFRNNVCAFFGQETAILRKRANNYMNELEDYVSFFEQTTSYMDYIDVTKSNRATWRRYKESWMKTNWDEKVVRIKDLSNVLKKVD